MRRKDSERERDHERAKRLLAVAQNHPELPSDHREWLLGYAQRLLEVTEPRTGLRGKR